MSLATLRTRVAPLLGLALFGLAAWLLHDALASVRYRDVVAALSALTGAQVAAAAVLTALGYLTLAGYDVLALRYIEKPVAFRRTLVASFIAYAVGHALGQSWLTGGSVRYRLYSAWGLSAANVAAVVAFSTFTFWLGFLALGGVVFLVAPPPLPPDLPLPSWTVPALGAGGVAATVAYLVLGTVRRGPLRVGGLALAVPPWRQRAGQVGVAVVDWLFASATLYVLLPEGLAVPYATFVAIYLFAVVAGIASQVPGGLGVVEGVVVLALGAQAPAPALVGSLVTFRAIYHLAPLALATLLLAAYEAARARHRLDRARRVLAGAVPHVAPQVLTVATFLAGVILLLSGATPAAPARLVRLGSVLPLPVIEAAHLAGSLAGAGLLLVARGLQLRLRAAHRVAAALLAIGIAASLAKGLDYEEAAALAVVLAALLPSGRYFFRPASLAREAMGPRWVGAVTLVMAGTVALGLFAFKPLAYAHDLWWRVALEAEAPRVLRAAAAVGLLLAAVAGRRFGRRGRPCGRAPADRERAAVVVAASPEPAAWLALAGDVRLLFSGSGRALVVYGARGGSLVALGDPVGADDEARELAWAFRETADREGAWPVFYRVGTRHLASYLDLGLTLLKIGEEARVPLGRAAALPAAPPGLETEVVPASRVSALLPALRAEPAGWLAAGVGEAAVASGALEPAYLGRGPVAVARAEGRVVAFAGLWLGAGRAALAPDLVRARPGAPPGAAGAVVAEVLRFGAAEGFRWCHLGMAPLATPSDPTLAPLLRRLGAALYRHGAAVDADALRRDLARFEPVFEPRYLAAPAGLALPAVVGDVAALAGRA